MRKHLISFVCLLLLSFAAVPVGAQTQARWSSNPRLDSRSNQQTSAQYDVRNRDGRYRNDVYNNSGYSNYGNYGYGQGGSFWDEHRDKITTAGGAAAGAVIGGLVGGTRGAILGAIAGGGGAALYTYKIRDKSFRF